MSLRTPISIALAMLASACGGSPPSEDVRAQGQALAATAIDPTPGASILATSADGRWIAYRTDCDATTLRLTIELLDDATGSIAPLGQSACRPGAIMPPPVFFSPDGRVVAFGLGAGVFEARDARTGVVAPLSSAAHPLAGLAFSPDSRWLVVATGGPGGVALDAWDASLAAPVRIADRVLWNGFGPPAQSAVFSPGADRVMFLAAPPPGHPPRAGTLTVWDRLDGTSLALASGVPQGGYVVDDEWRRVAYLENASAQGGPGPYGGLRGELAVGDPRGGPAVVVDAGLLAFPVGFARDALVYVTPDAGAAATMTLKIADADGASPPVVLDTGVFAPFLGATPDVPVSPRGDRVAYARVGSGAPALPEVRVADTRTLDVVTVAAAAAPAPPAPPSGWIDGGRTLVFLQPSASSPATGTLSAWSAADGSVTTLGAGVARTSVQLDAWRGEVLFVDAFDATSGAGDLELWDARIATTLPLGQNVRPESVRRSPGGEVVGFLSPPPATLTLALVGAPFEDVVASNVTSYALGGLGRVVYTTPEGLYGADGL